MTDIFYNFAANNNSLDEINGSLQGISEVQSDISNLFNILGTVYEGAGANALNDSHAKLNTFLEDIVNDATNSQKIAADQQAAMQSLDNLHAADLGG